MIHIKNHLAAWIALAVLLAVPPVSAVADNVVPPVSASNDSKDNPKWVKGVGDPFAGKQKSLICQGCHGVDGHSTDEMIPKLAGQYEGYIAKQMRNYQAGTRTHEYMNGMASPLSDQDLDDISAYFSNQTRMKGKPSALNKRGQELFLKGNIAKGVMICVYCHGGAGKGLESDIAMYPVIGGQNKAYLIKTLKDFRQDERFNSPSIIMNKIVRSLSDADIEALSDYMSSL
jgi:cytochrome c553